MNVNFHFLREKIKKSIWEKFEKTFYDRRKFITNIEQSPWELQKQLYSLEDGY